MEKWKDIKGYEGLYQVSNMGKVRSLAHFAKNNSNGGMRITSGKELAFYKMPNGYHQVQLSKGKSRKKAYIHRLVADAFIENSLSLPEVNHKDGNKNNNSVSNLEWISHKNNQIHMVKHGLSKRAHPVMCIETGKQYSSLSEAEGETGISRKTIKKLCDGVETKKTVFHWRTL